MKKIAVVLAGCGVYDGAEIHESVITMLKLKRLGCDYQCFAPDKPQAHVVDHISGQPVEGEGRSVLVESARIARGEIKALSEYRPDDFNALIFPGGFGVAKNLFTFAFEGADCSLDAEVQKAILDTHAAGKPIGAICISPVLMARAFRDTGIKIRVTAGTSDELRHAVMAMGADFIALPVDQICVDEANKIISCPAYTIANDIAEAASGIEKLVNKIVQMC
jgi:enhancing lycopene biosynthesis protein 2